MAQGSTSIVIRPAVAEDVPLIFEFIKELAEEWIERKNLTEMMNAPVQEDAAKNGFARMRELLGG